MKRLLAILLVLASLLCILPVSAADNEQKPIEVYYLGKKLDLPVPPQLIGNTTMVPMRAIFEALGYFIEWDAETKTVAAYLDDNVIALTVGETEAYINGSPQPLVAPAVLVNGSTLVPLRFIGEVSGYSVEWHEASRTITIEYSKEEKEKNEINRKSIIQDLQMIQRDLPVLHKNLFFRISRESFNDEINELINKVPNIPLEQIEFELIRIINSVGDTHTSAHLNSELNVDFKFFLFQEGLYLIDSSSKYEKYIGMQLTGINEFTIDQIYQMLSPIMFHDNPASEKYSFTHFLNRPYYLKLAGVIKSYTRITYEFGKETVSTSLQDITGALWSKSNSQDNNLPLSYKNNWRHIGLLSFPILRQSMLNTTDVLILNHIRLQNSPRK